MHNPLVPETLEGWSILHLMYRVNWDRVRVLTAGDISRIADEAVSALAVPDAGATAFVVMGKVAEVAPCGTVTSDGTTAAALSLVSVTVAPPTPAATLSFTVPVEPPGA